MKKHMKDTRKLMLRKEAIHTLNTLELANMVGGVQRPQTAECSVPIIGTGCTAA